MRLAGKTALITGAASGMGAAEASLFAAEGARVLVCDINASGGEKVAADIRSAGGDATFHRLDVTDASLWAGLVSSLGELHVLVNNAGINIRDGLMVMDMTDWDRIQSINLKGPLVGMRTCAPLIRDSGGGSMVNIGSLSGIMGHPNTAYAASKWALRGISKSAAMELVEWGIRVNMIHPGLIETPLIAAGSPAFDAMLSMTPMGRAAAPAEVAQAALFLASDESSFLTGVDMPVDGGFEATAAYRRVWRTAKGLA